MAKQYQKNRIHFLSFTIYVGIVCLFGIHAVNGIKCGTVDLTVPLIIGGNQTIRGEWPFVSALINVKESKFLCGGTIISTKHILSGKHNSFTLLPDDVVVRLGAYNLTDKNEIGTVERNVSEIHVHPDWNVYDDKYDADIAILLLNDEVEFTKYIRPVCIPANDGVVDGTTGYVVGWGLLANGTSISEYFPSYAITHALNDSYCYRTDYAIARFTSARTFCSGHGNGIPNRGDSGGGFFVFSGSSWVQYGVISALHTNATGHANVDSFAVYTNIKEFKAWITETVLKSGDVVGVAIETKINLYCDFNTIYHPPPDEYSIAYDCFLHSLDIREVLEVASLNGTHELGKTILDVDGIIFDSGTMLYLPDGIGKRFQNLEYFYVSSVGLKVLRRSNFKNMEKLNELHFFRNNIEAIGADTLWDLPNLEIFRVFNSKLKRLHETTFEKNTKLKSVNLSLNQLQFLPRDIFKNNLSLNNVSFQRNSLKIIETEFSSLTSIKMIIMYDNTCIDASFDVTVAKQRYDNEIKNLTEYQVCHFGIGRVCGIECGAVDVTVPLIIRGTQIMKGEWPFISALFMQSTFLCGGTLISGKHVLTAAHCIQEKYSSSKHLADDIGVRLGAYNLTSESEIGAVHRNVSEIYVHPDWDVYDDSYDADIAILLLDERVLFTKYIRPVCMPTNNTFIDGTTGYVVGWGLLENAASINDEFPSYAITNALNDSYCYRTDYGIALFSSPRTFCGGLGNGSPNRGDSGGGFFVLSDSAWVQYGIISALRTNKTGHRDVNAYAVYTNVKDFMNWISETVSKSGVIEIKLNFECVFMNTEKMFDAGYACNLYDLDILKEILEVDSFNGTHYPGKTDLDVDEIKFHNGTMSYLPDGIGQLFQNLKFFSVHDVGLELIRRSNFKNLENLSRLSFTGNALETIGTDTLWDLTNLVEFRLTFSKLKTLHRNTFEKNKKIKSIILYSNQLEFLPKEIFKHNELIQYVNFQSNNLKIIEFDFTTWPFFHSIFLNDNVCIDASYYWKFQRYENEMTNLTEFQSVIEANCSSYSL